MLNWIEYIFDKRDIMNLQKIQKLAGKSKYLKLLYVEDDELTQEAMLQTLSIFFDDITIAIDGIDGLNKFSNTQFDLVITDINMPKMNGIDMIFKIREIDKNVSILVLSAHDNSKYFEETIKAGIDGYLLKPIDVSQFTYLIEKTVNYVNSSKELLEYKHNLEEKVIVQTIKIKEDLYRDSNTGLYNFLKLYEDKESKAFKTIMILDITKFSFLSKQYGRVFTTNLLKKVATSLKQNLHANMQLYKLESDKFAVLYSDKNYELIKVFCEQVLAYFDTTALEIDNVNIYITFSIGISHISETKDCLIDAEYALGNAKNIGHHYYSFYDYDNELIAKEKEMIKWLNITQSLIQNDGIFPYYQPILDIKTSKIVKYEVLARALVDGKLIQPMYFIDAAQKLGMISFITRTIIQQSFQFFSKNRYDFSINISQRDILEGYLPSFLKQKLELYNIEASRVTLEILENITISTDCMRIQKELNILTAMGLQIAIDDFGIENSNFAILVSINLDIIKIDGFFIRNIVNSEKERLIVKSITSLAKTLGIKVVAEYVESKEILEIITELGIDYAQGYYIGKPSASLSVSDEV